MTPEQFWYDDTRLIRAYEKAYYRDVTFKAWVNGNYDMIATEKGARNALVTKKSDIDRTWVEYTDPIEKKAKQKPKKQDREEQRNQENWVLNTFFS
jgi:hypothetical protein